MTSLEPLFPLFYKGGNTSAPYPNAYWLSSFQTARITIIINYDDSMDGTTWYDNYASQQIFPQHPALVDASDHYNGDYNGACNAEAFPFQYLLANIHEYLLSFL